MQNESAARILSVIIGAFVCIHVLSEKGLIHANVHVHVHVCEVLLLPVTKSFSHTNESLTPNLFC